MSPSTKDAQVIEKILRDCGEMLLECLIDGRNKGEWSGTQFKATADHLAHNFLVSALNQAFPELPVVSEEDASSSSEHTGDYFIIDPIDGTASFSHGFAGWVTQAAYISEGRPIMAGIYAPATDEYFAAMSASGAYCNGRRLFATKNISSAEYLIDNYPEPHGISLQLMRNLKIPNYLESGSISLKICRVADGSADLFVKDMEPRDWDVAAPMLLIAEAGGILTDINGATLILGMPGRRHKGLISTTSPLVAEQVQAWLTSIK